MKFGVASQAFDEKRFRPLARVISEYGFDAIYLELKHIRDVDYRLGKLSTGFANDFAEEYARHGIKIPVLGCYSNLAHPDPEIRRYNIEHFKEHLRYARDFGASTVATETGTQSNQNPWDPHPDNQSEDNWSLLKSVLEELVEEAEKWGVFIALEGYYNNIINTPERMERMLKEVPSNHLGVVMDPCNYINREKWPTQDEVIQECFDRLGEYSLIAHAKDIYFSDTVKETTPAAGTGFLNHTLYYQLLNEAKPGIKIYFEHLNEQQMFASQAFIRERLKEISAGGQ